MGSPYPSFSGQIVAQEVPMRRITPNVRLLSLALVLLLLSACSGGDSDDASAASGTEVSPTEATQDERGETEPQQRDEAAADIQTQPTRRSASLSINTPTRAGLPRRFSSSCSSLAWAMARGK